MRLLVTGVEGQVARSLAERAPAHGIDVIAVGRPALDLAHPETVAHALARQGADVIVNAAAYTAVDQAESEPDAAFAINRDGAQAVAIAARRAGAQLIHLSTDYVFDGAAGRPYLESDPVCPCSAYGRSKAAGEAAVLAESPDAAILRLAWIYSPFGRNFGRTMLRLAQERDVVGVVADQHGAPTSALDIAEAVIAVAMRLASDRDPRLRGVFHMTSQGEATWAQFAQAIFDESARLGGPRARVEAITTAQYPTPARRPANSRLDCSKLQAVCGVALPHWRDSVGAVVARLLPQRGVGLGVSQ